MFYSSDKYAGSKHLVCLLIPTQKIGRKRGAENAPTNKQTKTRAPNTREEKDAPQLGAAEQTLMCKTVLWPCCKVLASLVKQHRNL